MENGERRKKSKKKIKIAFRRRACPACRRSIGLFPDDTAASAVRDKNRKSKK
jgi:hypothetical protein